jgi:hypothetical protein
MSKSPGRNGCTEVLTTERDGRSAERQGRQYIASRVIAAEGIDRAANKAEPPRSGKVQW